MEETSTKQSDLAPEEKEVTLFEFLTENDKLLAALGIFSALALFATNTPLKGLGSILFVIYFGITMIVGWELWKRMPHRMGNSLYTFASLLCIASVCMFGQLLLEVNHYMPSAISGFVTVGVGLPIAWAFNKFDIIDRISGEARGKKTKLRIFIARRLINVVLFVCIMSGFRLTPPVNKMLDAGYVFFSKQDFLKKGASKSSEQVEVQKNGATKSAGANK